MTPREMTAEDRRFVVPTWGLSSRYEGMSKQERFDFVDSLLDEGARVVVLARGRTVHAWACGSASALHYVYVPEDLRKRGLARRAITALLGSYPDRVRVTHPWPRESSRFVYAPHLVRIAA